MHYNINETLRHVFKIIIALPNIVPIIRTLLEPSHYNPGINFGFIDKKTNMPIGATTYKTFESNLLFVLRFMVDTNIVGASWITLPKDKCVVVKNSSSIDLPCN